MQRWMPGQVAPQAPAELPTARELHTYTPKHLAEKILSSRAALERERKQVTVLFADVKSSLELAESLDPEVDQADQNPPAIPSLALGIGGGALGNLRRNHPDRSHHSGGRGEGFALGLKLRVRW